MLSSSLNVAVPWNLSHYIPLNGFHPLYRALFDHAPQNVTLFAWDNVKLQRRFRENAKTRGQMLRRVKAETPGADRYEGNSFAMAFYERFCPPNKVMTAELMGHIEFHHTIPFPSLTRPFVFHCESVAPLLVSFVQDGKNPIDQYEEVKVHFGSMLANPLCLGIFSPVPETLESLQRFFSDPTIDKKLFRSRSGLTKSTDREPPSRMKEDLSRPRFLFVSAGSQNPVDFFRRGGHIVLRFWKEYLKGGQTGLLVAACRKPSDEDLNEYGVDISFVRSQSSRSIIWGNGYASDHEMSALMAGAHVLLSPSVVLDSISIMKAMSLGAVPVVMNTAGTSAYVTDNQNGIILQGVRTAIGHGDVASGLFLDLPSRMPDLEDTLVGQLTNRVCVLLDKPDIYCNMRDYMMAYARDQFSGRAFSDHFWSAVSNLYHRNHEPSSKYSAIGGALLDCTVQAGGWDRLFEGSVQPTLRINTGLGMVSEWGGAMIHTYGNPSIDLNDWSVLSEYCRPGAPQMTFANTLAELAGKYLCSVEQQEVVIFKRLKLVEWIAGLLKPFPMLYRFASRILFKLRSVSRLRSSPKPKGDPDVELVRHGVYGYNIIRRFDRYYAILQNEGVFVSAKVESGGYSSCFSGYSLEDVEHAIMEAQVHESTRTDCCQLTGDSCSHRVKESLS